VPVARGGQMLISGQVIESPETGLRYRIDRLLGEGGFGQAYLAARLGASADVPETVCIKVSPRMDGWIREAYFGQLLNGHPRAIRVFDQFPLMRADGQVLYYLALEYAVHGDLATYLLGRRSLGEGGRRAEEGFSEAIVRREIAGILEVLRRLHRGQTLHRDLTPMNLFVCDGPATGLRAGPSTGLRAGPKLKLGDFGIARQQSDTRGITAHTMNRMTAPSDLLDRAAPKWQARDDVYQVGQLLGMLIKGDARERIRTAEIRRLRCSDHLKEIVHRCIGERRKRYESADEMIEALRHPPRALKAGVKKTLKGVHLAFTGILSKPRRDAVRAAKRAGAIVHGMPSIKTSVVVRGRPNAQQAAGKEAGLKLMEIKRLRAKGHRITLLEEAQFWRLARRR
jgi:eukaryotic-like serine/threonine-protein kinase